MKFGVSLLDIVILAIVSDAAEASEDYDEKYGCVGGFGCANAIAIALSTVFGGLAIFEWIFAFIVLKEVKNESKVNDVPQPQISKPTTKSAKQPKEKEKESCGRPIESIFRYIFNAAVVVLCIIGIALTESGLYRGDKSVFLAGCSVGIIFSIGLIIFFEIAHWKEWTDTKTVQGKLFFFHHQV